MPTGALEVDGTLVEGASRPVVDHTLYVSTGGSPFANGLSWANALDSIPDALAIADTLDGQVTIKVARGNHTINELGVGIVVPEDVKLLLDPDAAIVRGSGVTGPLISTAAPADGLTIRGGHLSNGLSSDTLIALPAGSSNVTLDTVDVADLGDGRALDIAIDSALRSTDVRVVGCDFAGSGGTNIVCLSVPNADGFRVDGCSFASTGAVKSESNGTQTTSDVVVVNNRFRGCDATNVLIRPNSSGVVRDVVVADNTCEQAGVPLGKGFVVVGEQVGGSEGSSTTTRVVIANNVIKYFYGGAITIGGGVHSGVQSDIAIVGNVIDGANFAGTFEESPSSAGIRVIDASGVQVAGNRVERVGRSGVRLVGVHRATVTGNTCNYCAQSTTATAPAAIDEHGIGVFSGSNDVTISGNVCRNNGTTLSLVGSSGIGTTADGTIANVVVTGNRCLDDRGAGAVQAYGLRIGSSNLDTNQPVNFTVVGNDFSGNVSAGIGTFASTDKGHVFASNAGGGGGATSINGQLIVTSTSNSAATVKISAKSGQTSNILETYDVAGGLKANIDKNGVVNMPGGGTCTGQIAYTGSLTGSAILTAQVAGDTNSLGRFYVSANGDHNWGDGTNPTDLKLRRSAAGRLRCDQDLQIAGSVGFYAAGPVAKQTVTGSRGANAALASLLTALAALGLVTDSSTA
jgi:hypothetical protein